MPGGIVMDLYDVVMFFSRSLLLTYCLSFLCFCCIDVLFYNLLNVLYMYAVLIFFS